MIRKAILVLLTLGAVVTFVSTVASYRRSVTKRFVKGETSLAVVISSGSITVAKLTMPPGPMPAAGILMPRVFTRFADEPLRRSLFSLPELQSGTFPTGRSGWVTFVMPLWIPFVLFATYPATAFICGPLRRHLRRRKGQCLRCGYSLEGNVTGVCPECGMKTSSEGGQ